MLLSPKVCMKLDGELSRLDAYFVCNGRIVLACELSSLPSDALVHVYCRLRGGKGGFGSMLRAIGSQIEKTTNREMCRDLTGRRMRDVNTEQKLKEWYSKANDRDRERLEAYLERRRRRRELLEKGPLSGHKFEDRNYENQQRKIASDLHDAIDTAISAIAAAKRSLSDDQPSHSASQPKRSKLWIEKLDGDFPSTSSSSSSSSDREDVQVDEEVPKEIAESTPPSSTATSVPPDEGSPQQCTTDVSAPETTCISERETIGTSSTEKPEEQTPKVKGNPCCNATPLSDEHVSAVSSAEELEGFGLEVLKASLMSRGLKCGGSLSERAARLFAVRGLQPDQYPAKLIAKAK